MSDREYSPKMGGDYGKFFAKRQRPRRKLKHKFLLHTNFIILAGAISDDPFYLPENDDLPSMLSFRLWFTTETRNKDTLEYIPASHYIKCKCYGHQADKLHRLTGKFTPVLVTGHFRTERHKGVSYPWIAAQNIDIQFNLWHQKFEENTSDLSLGELFLEELESDDNKELKT